MPMKVKLIVDKDLGHVLASFAETDPRQPELTLGELLGTKLPVRNTREGTLELPVTQLVLKDVQVPTTESPVTQRLLLEQPRTYLFRLKRADDPEAVATSTNTLKEISLEKEILKGEKEEKTELTYIRVGLSTTTLAKSELVKTKAFVQAQGKPGPPQLYENIAGDKPGVEIEQAGTDLFIKIPITLLEKAEYDVLVLLDGFLAFVAEGLTVKPKPNP